LLRLRDAGSAMACSGSGVLHGCGHASAAADVAQLGVCLGVVGSAALLAGQQGAPSRITFDVLGMAVSPVRSSGSRVLRRLQGCGHLEQGVLDLEDLLEQRTVAHHQPEQRKGQKIHIARKEDDGCGHAGRIHPGTVRCKTWGFLQLLRGKEFLLKILTRKTFDSIDVREKSMTTYFNI